MASNTSSGMSVTSVTTQAIPIIDGFYLDVTPFGLYCNICQAPVGNNITFDANAIQKHSHRNHHKNTTGKSYTDIALLSRKIYNNNFRIVHNVESWIGTDIIESFSCLCGKLFKKEGNVKRHIKQMISKDSSADSNSSITHSVGQTNKFQLSKCGRTVDISIIQTMKKKASKNTVSTVSSLSSTTTQLINTYAIQRPRYLPVSANNDKWVTTTISMVCKKFNIFKRPDEDISP